MQGATDSYIILNERYAIEAVKWKNNQQLSTFRRQHHAMEDGLPLEQKNCRFLNIAFGNLTKGFSADGLGQLLWHFVNRERPECRHPRLLSDGGSESCPVQARFEGVFPVPVLLRSSPDTIFNG